MFLLDTPVCAPTLPEPMDQGSAPELRRKFYAAGSAPSIPSGQDKRLIGAVHEDPPSSKSSKLAPIRRAAQAMKRSAFRGRVQRYQALVAPGKWVPEKDWSQLSFVNVPIQAARRCKFFNTSVGCRCKIANACTFAFCAEAPTRGLMFTSNEAT